MLQLVKAVVVGKFAKIDYHDAMDLLIISHPEIVKLGKTQEQIDNGELPTSFSISCSMDGGRHTDHKTNMVCGIKLVDFFHVDAMREGKLANKLAFKICTASENVVVDVIPEIIDINNVEPTVIHFGETFGKAATTMNDDFNIEQEMVKEMVKKWAGVQSVSNVFVTSFGVANDDKDGNLQ